MHPVRSFRQSRGIASNLQPLDHVTILQVFFDDLVEVGCSPLISVSSLRNDSMISPKSG
jgi:hypothetical protein